MADVVWRTLDRELEAAVSRRQLPHWDQQGALTFITSRLADSMPKSVIQRWIREQEEWLRLRNITSCSVDHVLGATSISADTKNAFRKFRLQRWHRSLDDCHGSCVLRNPKMASIVGECLRYFDGDRYDLERFVVMPNHVHLLVQMREGIGLRAQCESWLRFSARKINEQLGKRGEFWQSEPFDHVVRSEMQFRYLQKYISENPVKAKLRDGDYLLWIRS